MESIKVKIGDYQNSSVEIQFSECIFKEGDPDYELAKYLVNTHWVNGIVYGSYTRNEFKCMERIDKEIFTNQTFKSDYKYLMLADDRIRIKKEVFMLMKEHRLYGKEEWGIAVTNGYKSPYFTVRHEDQEFY